MDLAWKDEVGIVYSQMVTKLLTAGGNVSGSIVGVMGDVKTIVRGKRIGRVALCRKSDDGGRYVVV